MKSKEQKYYTKMYEVGQLIGLSIEDVNRSILKIPNKNEGSFLIMGPNRPYWASFYGTFSIRCYE